MITFQGVVALATVAYVTVALFQWCAMLDANQHSDLSFKASQRPYVGIGRKDGTMGRFIEPIDPAKKASVLLYFHNGGQLPALNFNVQLFKPEGSTLEQHMARLEGENGARMQVAGGITIPGDSDRKAMFEDWISEPDVELAKSGKKLIPINGFFEYCDEFGGYVCTQFTGRYEPRQVPEFNLVMTGGCIYSYPKVDRWLPQKFRYLLPCEQPDELAKEQDLARRRMVQYLPSAIPAWTPPPSPMSTTTR